MLELEEREMSIRLECGWSGLSKDPCRNVVFDQSRLCEDRIVLSGPYGDDVAFIDQCDDEEILLGLSDGVSGTRHHGFDPYQFAHHLIQSCLEEHQRERITNSSSLRGVVHRAIRSLEKRDEIFGSATLCLMSIERSSSSLRSLNIGDSGFMLIRNQQLIRRSHPRYHRGSAPLQLATFPRTHLFTNHKTRFYQDRSNLQQRRIVIEKISLLDRVMENIFKMIYNWVIFFSSLLMGFSIIFTKIPFFKLFKIMQFVSSLFSVLFFCNVSSSG